MVQALQDDGFTMVPFGQGYLRRIFCNFLGEQVDNGEYPDDEEMLERMVKGVCFENAKAYFGI